MNFFNHFHFACSEDVRAHLSVNRFRRRVVLFVAGCLLCIPAQAQNQADMTAPLTWDRAIQRTLSENPELKTYGYHHAVQAGRVQQAGASTRPELSLTVEDALGSGDYQEFESAEVALSISWVMESALKQRRVDMAQARASVVSSEENIAQLDAVATTARLYLDVLANQASLSHAQDAVRTAENGVELIQRRTDAGLAPAADVAQAQAYVARVKLAREDVEHGLLVARHRLAAQWGARTPDFDRVSGDLFMLPAAEPFAELKSRVDQNPDLERFASAQRVRESELELFKVQRQPQWRFSAGIKHLAASDDQALMAGVSIPLGGSSRFQGQEAAVQARVGLGATEREVEALRIEIALFALHQELNHNLHVVKAHAGEILPRLETALADTRRAYEMGRYGYFEWQAVQQEMLSAKSTVIDASVNAHLNAIEIERLTGVSAQPIRQ